MKSVQQSQFGSVIDLGNEDLINQGKTLYATNCAGCHGPIDRSTKLGRTFGQINEAIANYDEMSHLAGLSEEQLQAISAALIFEAEGGGVTLGENGRVRFECTPGTVSRTPLLKLTNREFTNTLFDLLDIVSTQLKNDSELNTLLNSLPTDYILESHSRIEQSQLVTDLSAAGFLNAAFRGGELVADSSAINSLPGTNGCLSQSNISQVCNQSFVQQLANRALRRPVSAGEAETLSNTFWDGSLNKREQIIMTFTGIAQHPEFQYKIFNRGPDAPGQTNITALTSHELASRLSFFITGSPPDSQLRSLADSGALSNNATLDAQAERLLNSSAAQDMVSRLFKETLGYDVYEAMSYDDSFRNGISLGGLQNAMNSELDNFFTTIVLNNNGSFLDLMTSRQTNANHDGLIGIYGISQGTTTLPAARSGFLNRAAMLTKRSGFRASPIKRGLKVLESVLCVNVGSPPPSAPTSLPPIPNQILSTRDHTELTSEVEGSSCVACHSRINPLGYAFESFDSLGRVRVSERVFDGFGNEIADLPIRTVASSGELGEQTVNFSDSVDLSNQIGNSDRAMLCLARNLKRFEARTDPNNADNCQMNNALDSMYGNSQGQGSIKSAIKSLVLSDEFRFWSY